MEDLRAVKSKSSTKEVLRLVNSSSWKVVPKSSLRLSDDISSHIVSVRTQTVFYIEIDKDLQENVIKRQQTLDQLRWLTESDFFDTPFTNGSRKAEYTVGNRHANDQCLELQLEIGPRLNFRTPFCVNALSITAALSLHSVTRIEESFLCTIKYRESGHVNSEILKQACISHFMDPTLECECESPITSFQTDLPREKTFAIPVCKEGRSALAVANKNLSLGFDEDDLDYYTKLFQTQLKRDPTNLECTDLAQSNSEHSRHWFFNGKMIIDGEHMPATLFQMVKATNNPQFTNPNNIIKFHDNSSAIYGFDYLPLFRVENPRHASAFEKTSGTRHIIFTAETHNFPTAVEPFSGATTGTGGRIRDVQAAGRGAHVIAGTVGYSFGSCYIPGFDAPWEEKGAVYPGNFASPLKVIIEASNGASDYGNKFGEPVITGFARSFGASLPGGARCEWIKPIMFSGGIGSIDQQWTEKEKVLTNGTKVVKIGGPVYNIGLGGGAASSTSVQGSNDSTVDLNAVQRGDAEMEQKLNRVIRACIELEDNPIVSIHDQGAGGNANVLKEIVDPAGAIIKADQFTLGDETISIVALWNAEYQESVAVLVPAHKIDILKAVAHRERCAVDVVGEITGSGKIVLEDFKKNHVTGSSNTPVDLPLELVLGDIPTKTYHLERHPPLVSNIGLEQCFRQSISARFNLSSMKESLYRVLRLPSVGSKRYLTNKVDRSVTGLIAQQQCVGPLHTPLADVAVVALSYFETKGSATAIGEQPIKMLFDVKRGARMTVIESLTNLMFAKISALKDVKCSANWMWPAKLPGEGAALYDACEAMCDIMKSIGIAVDGGKDSLSMAAKCGEEIVKSPGTLVVSTYVQCPDIRKVITPSLKVPGGKGILLWIDPGRGRRRLGGSAYCQANCLLDIPFEVPDVDCIDIFVRAFELTQSFLEEGKLSAGHDISDGGLIVCLLEMAIAGNCVFHVNIETPDEYPPEYLLFAEEVGWVLEVSEEYFSAVLQSFSDCEVPCFLIGQSLNSSTESRSVDGKTLYAPFISIDNRLVFGGDRDGIAGIRSVWESFSYHIEKLQANEECAESERIVLAAGADPTYSVSFAPDFDICDVAVFEKVVSYKKPRAAIIREEGSNGDREMAAALHMVGFEVWDVNVQDLLDEQIDLGQFRGLVFVGGFSYADVFGSAKGWAAVLAFSPSVRKQLETFYNREDTFSLGICNGCQLLTKLGLVGHTSVQSDKENHIDVNDVPVELKHNNSRRFESRFPTVKITKSNSVMLRGMEGTQMGVWAAHGEGKFTFRDGVAGMRSANCIALQYVDSLGHATETYPLNPNGSPEGVAGICSPSGRHLVMMPHPERSILTWQWPWCPTNLNWKRDAAFTPWIKMFRNAYEWCCPALQYEE